MAAFFASDPCKAIMEDAAVKPAPVRLTAFLTHHLGSLLRKQYLAIDTRDQVWARGSDK